MFVLKGFRDFVMRGSVVELAVGIVMGAAFGGVVNQFIKSFVDPLVKLVLPGRRMGGSWTLNSGKGAVIDYGGFISQVITFLLTALVIYLVVVVPMNRLAERRKRGAEPEPEAPSEEVLLLTDIRDELRSQRGRS